jgi:dTDP-4-amino-4,6-dideoxygalactose transaminase
MRELRVPFNRVVPVGRELEYMRQALERGHVSGNGPFTRTAEALLERELGAPRVLLTTSCTHALEMCALLLDVQPGDEVIVPSFTFVSTVNAFALRGAKPVFVDIRPDTLNIDETLVRAAMKKSTRAIVVVHYAGVACDLGAITAIADEYRVPVIEDAAHALFGTYRGAPLATFGSLATLSFHETKNVSCGEGGALVINDPALVERAEIVREKGTDRSRFLRGEVDRYTWQDLGSSYILSDLLAGFLLGQLEARHEIQERRRIVFERYHEALAAWARRHDVGMLLEPADCRQPYHMFFLRCRRADERDSLIASLRSRGILAVSHYVPLHASHMGRRFGYARGDLPVTEAVSDQLVRLPFYPSLSEDDQRFVCEGVLATSPQSSDAPVHG